MHCGVVRSSVIRHRTARPRDVQLRQKVNHSYARRTQMDGLKIGRDKIVVLPPSVSFKTERKNSFKR